ncbi:MAG TPA: DNA-3-methyladenine glycosylase [Bacteroidales bacterium]|nr:DNA-3-methyladenine glycosylase [Bacteroidales bacterium]HPI68329.1 DNA-3-methyladenine glycosylase [Bacteroidales bacterium]
MNQRYLIDRTPGSRLPPDFFRRDVLLVAPELLGKILVVRSSAEMPERFMINETEAYRGAEDKACHASKGRTERTDVMFRTGGKIYVYLIYGIHWMLNFVTGPENEPQAVLIRGIEGYDGPGRVSKVLGINKSFYGEDLNVSERIWIEDNGDKVSVKTGKRIGIDYAGEKWVNKPWRFFL